MLAAVKTVVMSAPRIKPRIVSSLGFIGGDITPASEVTQGAASESVSDRLVAFFGRRRPLLVRVWRMRGDAFAWYCGIATPQDQKRRHPFERPRITRGGAVQICSAVDAMFQECWTARPCRLEHLNYFHSQIVERAFPSASTSYSKIAATLFSRDHLGDELW